MPEPLTPNCPLCGEPPMMIMGGGAQAFCGNDDGCTLLTWDPSKTLDENLMDARGVDWEPAATPGDPPASPPGRITLPFCRGCLGATTSVPCPRCDGPACARCGRCPPCDGELTGDGSDE
jgi:hypothetical protein